MKINNKTPLIAVLADSSSSLYASTQALAQKLSLPLITQLDNNFDLYLVVSSERLQLQAGGADAPGPVFVDFVGGALGHRLRFSGGRRGLLGRAVGVGSKVGWRLLDLTAGLGRDAYLLATMGCDVTMVECSPIVAALLRDGLRRAALTDSFTELRLDLIETDSRHYLKQLARSDYPDVIYLDPMFPVRTKSALVKKEMRLLKQVVGDDYHDAALFRQARTIAKKRVVIKRHRHAPTIDASVPDIVYKGKRCRFDVYIARQ